jgi:hypothetical protein
LLPWVMLCYSKRDFLQSSASRRSALGCQERLVWRPEASLSSFRIVGVATLGICLSRYFLCVSMLLLARLKSCVGVGTPGELPAHTYPQFQFYFLDKCMKLIEVAYDKLQIPLLLKSGWLPSFIGVFKSKYSKTILVS